MKVAILGATKGMGRALGQQLAARGDELFVLGRPGDDLDRTTADLQARSGRGITVRCAPCDLAAPESFGAALDAAWKHMDGVDAVIVTAAQFATQDALEADVDLVQQLLTVNFANTVVFCEHARKRLLAQGGGKLVVFSSVAGDRGRKPVIIYGASKAGLSAYLEGLDHKYAQQGLQVLCVKPGFVKTGMTQGLRPPPFAGEPDQIARAVLRAMDSGTPLIYAPAMWRYIMLIIRCLPRFVMRKIGF